MAIKASCLPSIGFKGFRGLKPGLIDFKLGLGTGTPLELRSIRLSLKPSLMSFNQGLMDPKPRLRGLA